MVVRVASPDRLGQERTRSHDGGFQLPVPMGIETSLYEAKYLFIDGDGVCTPPNDRAYRDFSFIDDDMTFVLQGSVPRYAPSA